eukprot:340542_1
MSQANQHYNHNAVTEVRLESLLPNGLCKSRKLAETESIKMNSKIIKSKKHNIKPANKYLIICIKGKCRESLDKNKITSFTAPIVRQQSRKSQIKQPHYKYRIPVATNGMTMKIFSTKEGKYIFAISFNINDELYHGRCILCHRWRLKFIHDLQQGTAENETSMETCASEVGGIYTPNRRAFLNETLKKKFINKRTLSRNLKIRRKLVRKVIKYHRKHYKGTGLLKHKRKTNVKYSTSLDRLEHLQDDRMGVIDDNDLCPSEKNFECEYD